VNKRTCCRWCLHAKGVENREKADIGNPEKPYEIAKLRMDNAHAKVEDLRKQLKDLETQNVRQEELKLMLKKGFMEFYYSKRRTKEQRQGILQRLIRRIDVGPQELTVSWLFMNEGKRRIPRSVTDPKGGHGKPRKYDPRARKKGVSDDCIPERNAGKKAPSGASGGRLVEIGAANPLCVHIRPEKQALLSVLRESVRGSCQEPSVRARKQRKARRGKRVRA
jgi:hypothetical protein